MTREEDNSQSDQPLRLRRLLGGTTPLPSKADVCPQCGGPSGKESVKIQVWKQRLFTLDFTDERWSVHQVTAPPHCAACASALRKQRTMASVLSVSPVLILLALAPPSKKDFLSLLIFFFYSFYLVKWGSCTWADMLLYGNDLRQQLKEWIPNMEGKVRFSLPALQCLLRLALFFVGGFVVLMLRELVTS